MKVLLAGESWCTVSHHTKGFDTFTTSKYEEGAGDFLQALRESGLEVDFLPNHLAVSDFPSTIEALSEYSVCVLSDIGSNSLLLHPQVFDEGRPFPNRLAIIREWVAAGGALLMVGGYLSFQGIQGMANYRNTVLADVLPVEMEVGDDRQECPEGAIPRLTEASHPVVDGLDAEWPRILGFHRLYVKRDATVLAEVNGHPLLVVGRFGAGRTAAFASDMAAHWLPRDFVAWGGYSRLFSQLVGWLGEKGK